MKECRLCKDVKPLEKFSLKRASSDGYQSECKLCKSQLAKKYYQADSERYKKNAMLAKQASKSLLRQVKAVPCMDCGESYPYYVMDLDHREGEQKLYEISKLANSGAIEKLKTEMSKCDVVCSNCHRMRTHNRLEKGVRT